MEKKELLEFNNLRKDVRRLEQVISLLLRRVNLLEKQNRTLKANAHQAGLNVAHIDRTMRGGPYDPPQRGDPLYPSHKG
jgi:hypothetical protein